MLYMNHVYAWNVILATRAVRYFESGGYEQQKIFKPTLSLSCGVQKKKQRNESTMKVLVLLLSIAGAVFLLVYLIKMLI